LVLRLGNNQGARALIFLLLLKVISAEHVHSNVNNTWSVYEFAVIEHQDRNWVCIIGFEALEVAVDVTFIEACQPEQPAKIELPTPASLRGNTMRWY
jgi:hypothetical protein